MRMTPIVTPRRLATLIAAGAALILVSGWEVAALPGRPEAEDTVLERLPLVTGPAALELRRLRRRPAADRDPAVASAAAERLLALGQTLQDPRLIGNAAAVLRPWWADPSAPPALLVLRAAIKQNRHDFAGALADLDAALEADPGDPRAWASKATILLVQGRPEAALQACAEVERRAASISGTICRAAALARLGRSAEARVLLKTTLDRSHALAPAVERWARLELAEIGRLLGQDDLAERQLRAALRLEPLDAAAATALADLLLDQRRPQDALVVLGDDLAHDGKLMRTALALRALNEAVWRAHAALLAERLAAARARGDNVHQREEARLHLALLDQPARALELAQASWDAQREPWDARLLLESAVAANAPAAAEPVLAWLEETGFRDPALEPTREKLTGARP
jgi:tetratricopeptide (TPR) repeat protein